MEDSVKFQDIALECGCYRLGTEPIPEKCTYDHGVKHCSGGIPFREEKKIK